MTDFAEFAKLATDFGQYPGPGGAIWRNPNGEGVAAATLMPKFRHGS
jgi:hypothetical protein